MTSFYYTCLNVDVTGKDNFLRHRTNECEDFCQIASQRRTVSHASQGTVHFLSTGFPGKYSSIILKLNILLSTPLFAEEAE